MVRLYGTHPFITHRFSIDSVRMVWLLCRDVETQVRRDAGSQLFRMQDSDESLVVV